MAAERQIPGGPYVNEVGTAQRQIPGWRYINETVAASSNKTLACDAGSYSLTGVNASLVLQRNPLAADAGAFSLTGDDATLTYTPALAKSLSVDAGAYDLTGDAAALLLGRAVVASEGSYALTGIDAALADSRVVVVESGAYSLTGVDATLDLRRAVVTEVGSFAVTGDAATFTRTLVLSADAGSFAVSGQDISAYQSIFIRPDATLSAGTWTTDLGGTDLETAIDETVIDDADYIQSAESPANDTCQIRMSDPGLVVTRPVVVTYRYKKDTAAQTIDLTVKLVQTPSTVIATWNHADIGTDFVTAEQTLSEAEFLSVTDWNSVHTEFIANAP